MHRFSIYSFVSSPVYTPYFNIYSNSSASLILEIRVSAPYRDEEISGEMGSSRSLLVTLFKYIGVEIIFAAIEPLYGQRFVERNESNRSEESRD